MDISHNNNTWDLDMTVENPIIHDQLSYDLIYQNYPLQAPQVPSSIHVPSSNFPTDHAERSGIEEQEEPEEEELGAMKEMMYKIAAMQPVDIDPTTIHKPKRRNVRISDDPQSVAARRRRERISEKMRILQRLVPGGTKMDTASMLDEAIRYVKFLKRQVHKLQSDQNSTCTIVNNHFEAGNWPIRSNNIHGCTSSTLLGGDQFSFGGGISGGEDDINHLTRSFNYEVSSE